MVKLIRYKGSSMATREDFQAIYRHLISQRPTQLGAYLF